MKTDNGNIDELLRQEFENFAPDAPDVWNAVANGIHQTVPQPSATVVTKAAATSVKMWAAVASIISVAVAVTVWVVYTPNTQPDTINPAQVQVNDLPQQAAEIQPEVVASPQPNTEVQEAQKQLQKPIQIIADKQQSTSIQTEQQTASQSQQPDALAPVVTVRADEKRAEIKTTEPTTKQNVNQQEQTTQKVEPASAQTSMGVTKAQAPEPFIPNVITPNADGLNDVFIVEIPEAGSYRIKIVGADNQVVFESNSIYDNWNGTDMRNGENCREGIYVYVIHYQTNTGEGKTIRGKVKLIRD